MRTVKNINNKPLNSVRIVLIFSVLYFLSVSDVFSQSNIYFNHININNGLSSNHVNCIYKDKQGFMWFGTMSGLNRFDGYTFKVFRHDIHDTTSLSDNFVNGISTDHFGRMWINTRDEINIFDPDQETFIISSNEKRLDSLGVDAYYIDNIIVDKKGNYWYVDSRSRLYHLNFSTGRMNEVMYSKDLNFPNANLRIVSTLLDNNGDLLAITRNGIIICIDVNTKEIKWVNDILFDEVNEKLPFLRMFVDNDNDIWINATSDALGVYYLKMKENKLYHFEEGKGSVKLNTNLVNVIEQDESGLIWLATDHGGINIIDKEKFTISYLKHDPNDEKSISQNSVTTLFKDNTGIIWAGTFKKGISYYHEDIIKFKSYKNISSDKNSLTINDVNCFVEDEKGNIWIGTNGGGLDYFNRKTGEFKHYTYKQYSSGSISNNIIINLFYDSKGILWIGTYYGGLNYYDGKQFRSFKADEKNPKSISDNRIWTIFEDSEKNLWIGTLGGGLDKYDREKNVFYHYNQSNINSVGSNYISDIVEDEKGNLWFGTAHGISIFEKSTQRFFYLTHKAGDTNTLSNNNITSLIYDENGYLWMATREGLNIYDPIKKEFKIIRQANGLSDNVISTILKDDNNNLWLSTANGISNIIILNPDFDSLSYTIKNYDESDGLQGKEFNQNSALKTSSGELIFGGANGFNIVHPDKIRMNKIKPKVVFTGFSIYNNQVEVNEVVNGRVILEENITKTKHIKLKHKESMFTIGYAALNYFQPEKNKYEYRLKGFNDKWLTGDINFRKVTFTNLDEGDYEFQVRAANNDGYWNKEGQSLIITILPPIWRTKWAFMAYALLLIGVLLLLRQMVLERERTNYRAQQQRLKSQRRHELDLLKIRFFTNISHEFKTPLALIISPLEKIIKNTTDPGSVQQFQLIYRNARRLLNLVNQLLDFRRMEMQGIKLTPSPGEIVSFVKDIVYSFTDLSDKKDIQLNFVTKIDELNTYFDHDKVEKIIFNLLSNAFKFTPEKGTITLNIDLMQTNNQSPAIDLHNRNEMIWVVLKVTDTGIGIPKEKQEKIFERFFQDDVPGTMLNQGSGIGLSLVHEFVRLHKGKITVYSVPGQGSSFTVMLPVTKEIDVKNLKNTFKEESLKLANTEAEEVNESLPLILIVEDNEDFRFYLKDNLRADFNIIEAPNGKIGFEKAVERQPDLIVSDVMMPEMDGIELCQKIKKDKKTAQIPLILLTAITSEDQKVKGFDYGADDYITKPFSFEILESRIKNLLSKHEVFQAKLKNKVDLTLSEIEITSKDEKLIQKALALVETNLSNPDFSVEELSREVGMSRVHLYKKLLSLTGKTPIEFIRTIRLKRAAQLLGKSQMSVSEVAYKVGFNNPKYFTKYFKAEYKMLPSLYAQQKEKELGDDKEFMM